MALSLVLLKLNASKKNYYVIFVINDVIGVCPGPIFRPKEIGSDYIFRGSSFRAIMKMISFRSPGNNYTIMIQY